MGLAACAEEGADTAASANEGVIATAVSTDLIDDNVLRWTATRPSQGCRHPNNPVPAVQAAGFIVP